jgi:sporulation protein YlmC with PRC-barrel domain
MRLSALLGLPVIDADRRPAGTVADIRLVQDGPLLGAFASWRVSGLIVVERSHVRMLGYERNVGPAIARLIMRRLAGNVWFIPWEHVGEVRGDQVAVATTTSQWESLEDLPGRTTTSATR